MCGLWLMGEGLTHRAGGEGGGEDGVKGHEQTRGLGKRRQRSRDVCTEHGCWGIPEPSSGFR